MDTQDAARLLGEADAPVADAEAEFLTLAPQPLEITQTAVGQAIERREHPPGDFAVQAADILAGVL
jgi:hypothetical protein